MNSNSFFENSPKDNTEKSERKFKTFKDISKYFSKKDWESLGYSKKTTYVYMKRNYDTMTGLGLRATLPPFMCANKQTAEFSRSDTDEDGKLRIPDEPPREIFKTVLERNPNVVILQEPAKEVNELKPIPEIQVLEKEQKQLGLLENARTSEQQSKIPGFRERKINTWTYRLRERKNLVVYEEISDPEEEEDVTSAHEKNLVTFANMGMAVNSRLSDL